ncbi:hypothetical protein BJ742DRAFT_821845 [Cladochytrium replicatum]|nr:hypothetical protein BJ742DRAFT_821845 [Cladochytrium replicatum]
MAATTTTSSSDFLDFYKTHGLMTEPGRFLLALPTLSTSLSLHDRIQTLATVVYNTCVHEFHLDGLYGISPPKDFNPEVHTHTVRELLQIVQSKRKCGESAVFEGNHWTAESKAWINCRHFSLLMVSLLRHNSIPARTRCGFGRYFPLPKSSLKEFWFDHWIAEAWDADEGRWIMIDPELSPIVTKACDIKFDPCDVPRGEFICAAEALQMVKAEKADPETFGLPVPGLTGMYMIEDNVYRDFWALNNFEVLPWETFNPGPNFVSDVQKAEVDKLFERIVELTSVFGNGSIEKEAKCFEELRKLGSEGFAKVGSADQIWDQRMEKLVALEP